MVVDVHVLFLLIVVDIDLLNHYHNHNALSNIILIICIQCNRGVNPLIERCESTD